MTQAAQPAPRPRPFVVHATPAGLLKGLVTGSLVVHPREDGLYFLRGQGSATANVETILATQGLLGALLGMLFGRRRKAAQAEKLAGARRSAPTRSDLESELRADAANFVLTAAEIQHARIDPPGVSASNAKGSLSLELAGGERRSFLFLETADMTKAVRCLERMLGARLELNAEWDRFADRWVRRRR